MRNYAENLMKGDRGSRIPSSRGKLMTFMTASSWLSEIKNSWNKLSKKDREELIKIMYRCYAMMARWNGESPARHISKAMPKLARYINEYMSEIGGAVDKDFVNIVKKFNNAMTVWNGESL